jgi:hypothetical protein
MNVDVEFLSLQDNIQKPKFEFPVINVFFKKRYIPSRGMKLK